jgi:CHAT domain-containing protein/tetratricopeptide (TPR) repeat protein
VLLARVESSRGPDALEVADVLDLLWSAVVRSSKVTDEDKTGIAERAVAIKEKKLDPSHPDLARSLIHLGVQRTLLGDPAAGKPLLERALAIREAAFGPDHPLVAGALQQLAGLLMTLHDDAGAKVLLERAQRIRETAYGAGHPDTIRTLVKLAVLYQETGDYTSARQRYERALTFVEQSRWPADPLTLNVLSVTAIVLSDLGGDVAGSARVDERLLALMEQTYGPTDPRLTTPLANLAIDRRDLGDYTAAKMLAERSLTIAESALGPKHAEVARSLHLLATILAGLGDYSEAMRLFERATRINEEVRRPSNPESARASWFIPDLLPLSGYGADDMELFERMLAIREKSGGFQNPHTAESLSNLAAVLSREEDYRRTRPLFERALESQERFLGPDHPEVAASATNLAYVVSRTGDDAAARSLYERALSIWESSLGVDHPKVATALVNLARLCIKTGNYQGAAPLLARALAIQEKSLGPEHPDLALTLTSQAELAAHTGATTDAFAIAARAEALSREHLRLTVRTLPERQALAYASSVPPAIDLMLKLAALRAGDSQMSTTAWDAVIRTRAMVLDEMASRHRAASAGGAKEIAGLAEAFASARQRLATIAVRGIRNEPPERYRRLGEQARAEKDRAERALAETSVEFRDDQSRSRVGLHELSAALPPESALVAFVRYRDAEPSYLAFVLRGSNKAPAIVPIGNAARVDRLILEWRKQLDREAMSGRTVANLGEAAYRRVAGQLSQLVWDPIVKHLSNAKRVFIVPDGSLHIVSFASLPTGRSGYLAESGPLIHYLSAERDLFMTEASPPAGEGLLALGDPLYDSGLAPAAPGTSFRGARSSCRDFQSMQFDQLPASSKEVDQVVALWKQSHPPEAPPSPKLSPSEAIRLTGAAATESAFKSQAPGKQILHLGTHGFFLGDGCASALERSATTTPAGVSTKIARENPLILSGLILAGANHRNGATQDQDDGVLTAEEVASLNLSGVEWAVLSGCDTGVGEVRAGEGVFGLRRAFQVAGAKTVIMSLWPVEDQTTREWMTALYQGRLAKKMDTANAVRDASLALLHQRRAKGLSTHPFHWAAFVAAGDWR